ncbi:MAG: Vms1/Ankzf1 family peptidyl-tRNA hydrolase [Mycobacteriales bacterium]
MDISTLTDLYAGAPPFASVYLDIQSDVADAAARLETRWKDVVRDLAGAQIGETAIDALTAAIGEHGSGGTRVLVADADGVGYARSFPEPTDTTTVRTGPLPHLLPLLELAQSRLPHVVVLTDRTGADLFSFTDEAVADSSSTVETDAWPVHKVNPGGWQTHRFQHAVEEEWHKSAREIAKSVTQLVDRTGARVVFVAGDVHAVGLLREALPVHVADLVREIDGSRHPDGSADETESQVAAALSAAVLSEMDDLLESLQTYVGRGEKSAAAEEVALKGADGVAATVEALQRAQVETLLLADTLERDDAQAPLVYGADGTQIALSPRDLGQLGTEPAGSAPQADVLVRAALLTGARVRVVPAAHPACPTDGVGALLRFSVTT